MDINLNDLIKDMECFANAKNIPIMINDSILYIEKFIKENNIKNILEIGTAIGYSTIRMCSMGTNVVSIERDLERYKIAVENVKLSKMSDNITLINKDAFDVLLDEKFDMILVDAAKGKNIEFINKFKSNLNIDGYIIIDNVDFHGLVNKSEEIKSRNLRSLVRKIERFLNYLNEQKEFNVKKISVGDGLIILSKGSEIDEVLYDSK